MNNYSSIISEARHYRCLLEQNAVNAEVNAMQADFFQEDPEKYLKKAAEYSGIAEKILEAECKQDEKAAKELIEKARRALIDVKIKG